MRSKLSLFTTVAIAALSTPAMADDAAAIQTPDTPAATQIAPTPTMMEEIVYLRDQMAAQALRLDQAEQSISRQQRLIDLQDSKIEQLEAELSVARSTAEAATQTLAKAARNGSINVADLPIAGAYRVKSGDTLGAIARRSGTTVGTLARLNNIRSPYTLSVGQSIQLPGAPAAQAQVASAPASPPAQATVADAKFAQPTTTAPSSDQPQRVAAVQTRPTPPGPQEDPGIHERAVDQQRRRNETPPEESGLPQEVGVRPEEDAEAPFLALFADVGGILTPKGRLFLEPAVDFTASSDNRFFFNGVEIVDAVLVGAIEATDVDRLAITERLGLRYGITSRLEVDATIPYVYREDRQTGIAIDDLTTIDDARFGAGLGDVAFGIHYQLNQGKKWPYLVANLRAKAPTGTGPFDVARAPNGQETELPVGSGFWSIEPSLSFILPSAPASIFGNIGYQSNRSVSPNQLLAEDRSEQPLQTVDPNTNELVSTGLFQVDTQTNVLELDPGDAIFASLGVGLSLNDRLSMNFGYDHRYFFATETTRETIRTERNLTLDRDIISEETFAPVQTVLRQSPTTVGNFLFGASYLVNDRVRLNLNTGIGATDEAADFRVSIRAQVKLKD